VELLLKILKKRMAMVEKLKYVSDNGVELVIDEIKNILIFKDVGDVFFVFNNGDEKKVNLINLMIALENDNLTQIAS